MGQQVKSALRYPIVRDDAAMVAAIGVINVMVIPAFAGVFARAWALSCRWPTRISASPPRSFTIRYGWAMLVGSWVGVGAFALQALD